MSNYNFFNTIWMPIWILFIYLFILPFIKLFLGRKKKLTFSKTLRSYTLVRLFLENCKLNSGYLNPNLYPRTPISIYTCKVIITLMVRDDIQ